MSEIRIGALEPESPDAAAVAHYGDPMREQRTLATAAGLVDRSHGGVLHIDGADRRDWLHNLTTQHLATLTAGQGTELLVLSPHGHIEHQATVAEDGDATWLTTEPAAAGALLAFLEGMRFMLRVQPTDVTDEWALLSLVGPAATVPGYELAAPRADPVPPARFAAAEVPARSTSGYPVASLPAGGWVRRMPYGYDLLVARRSVAEVAAWLDVPWAGLWAFEAMRVQARRPRFGWETDHRSIPAELGWLASAVHLNKGCYRGQETVARVHNLGRPPRRLVLLHLDGVTSDQLPAHGTPVHNASGRQVGQVGTAVRHFELGSVALALIKRSVDDREPLLVADAAAAIDPDGEA